jgi:hypothetical protein
MVGSSSSVNRPVEAFQNQRIFRTTSVTRSQRQGGLPLRMTFLSMPPSQLSSSSGEFSYQDESQSTDDDSQLLGYLPDNGSSLPPLTKSLVRKATENYIYGTIRRPITFDQLISAIEEEYRCTDVPLRVGSAFFDVSSSGEEVDESIAEVLSMAALHRIPKEITLELVAESLADASTSWVESISIFAQNGWDAVSFPKGLALRPKRKYATDLTNSPKTLFGWRQQKALVEAASRAVSHASVATAPKRRLKSRDEFLSFMATQLSATANPSKKVTKEDLLFFPRSIPMQKISFSQIAKKLKRTADRQYAMLKAQGRAGFLAYAYFNFVFYTAGILWQWRRVAPADPFSNSSVMVICLRKFGRVFGSLYILSSILKLPKLFSAVAMAPAAKLTLERAKKKLNVGDNYASALIVGLLAILWSGIVAVPFFTEYARLRRFLYLDRVVQGYVFQPV